MKANPVAGDSSKGRTLLKDKAYLTLKEHILTDRYPPGSALAERRLAQELGMSKTPVKAALERLELEGYIVIAPQQFVRVRELDPAEIAEQYEMRTALESYIVGQLAGKLTPENHAELRASIARQRELLSTGDIGDRVAIDSAFHLLLAQLLGNQSILRIVSDLQDRNYRVITRLLQKNPGRYAEIVDEHDRIVSAIVAGKSDEAMKLLVDHLKPGLQISLS